ncbi:SGNH/GDSL hydrolase family protein [Metallumcola ferriviriculae]|uniref:SGNH/GDSL hydrolase family protein n=1 Tax=Metallumcola ferriviriculae TaxID=3039180 RepID=A0AAU0ULY5_9FIRM|nr:SGNH/GDSL hydrolase family protein [Desulfitibacteraceae bacterium MK1]
MELGLLSWNCITTVGYYNAFPYLPENVQQNLIPLTDVLNQTLAQAIELSQTDAVFVPTFDAMAAIGEEYELFFPEANIHPSEAGYQAIAGEFLKVLNPLELMAVSVIKDLDAYAVKDYGKVQGTMMSIIGEKATGAEVNQIIKPYFK